MVVTNGAGFAPFIFAGAWERRKMNVDVRMEELVVAELDNLGYELIKLETNVRGRRRIVRIFIDRSGEGVTLDDCVQVTKRIGFVLDGEEIITGPYNLEVSSPGIDRSLTKPAHFERFKGHSARITHAGGSAGKETAVGIIVDTDDVAVTIRGDGGTRRIDFDTILKANLHGEHWEIPKGERNRGRSRAQ
jgi:ribosome maturation factor RimP